MSTKRRGGSNLSNRIRPHLTARLHSASLAVLNAVFVAMITMLFAGEVGRADSKVGASLAVGVPSGVMDWSAGADLFWQIPLHQRLDLDLRLAGAHSGGNAEANGDFTLNSFSLYALFNAELSELRPTTTIYVASGPALHELSSSASDESTLDREARSATTLKWHALIGINQNLSRSFSATAELRLTAPSNIVVDLLSVRLKYAP